MAATTKYAYYRHDTFVYRAPEPDPAQDLDLDAMRQMEIWNGRAWAAVPPGDRVLVMFEGGPISAETAAAQTGDAV